MLMDSAMAIMKFLLLSSMKNVRSGEMFYPWFKTV